MESICFFYDTCAERFLAVHKATLQLWCWTGRKWLEVP